MKEEANTIREASERSEEKEEGYQEGLKKLEEWNGELRALYWMRGMIAERINEIANEIVDHVNWMGTQGWRVDEGWFPYKVPKNDGSRNG